MQYGIQLYDLIIVTVLGLFGLAIRLPFALLYTSATDSVGEYSKLKSWRKKKWNDFRFLDSANDGIFPRPALYHYWISRFPRKYWRLFAILGNHLSDVLVAIITYFAFIWTMQDYTSMTAEKLRFSALLASIVFLTTPLLFPNTARLKANNGRSPSILYCTIYFLLLIYTIVSQSWLLIVPLIILIFIILHVSTFGTQAIMFFGLPLAIYFQSVLPFVLPVIVITTGWFIPSSGIKQLLTFKRYHIQFYLDKLSVRNIDNRSLVTSIFQLVLALIKRNLKDVHSLVIRNSPLIILSYSVPILFIGCYLLFIDVIPESMSSEPIWDYGISMLIASSVVFVFTSFGYGKVFGESERYFEYSAPMITFMIVFMFMGVSEYAPIVLSLLIITQLSIVVIFHLFRDEKNIDRIISYDILLSESHSQEMQELIGFLQNGNDIKHVATVPIKLARLLSSFTLDPNNVQVKYYYHLMLQFNGKSYDLKNYQDEVKDFYDFKIGADELKEKYGIDYIIIDKNYSKRATMEDNELINSLINYPICFQNERYYVYKTT